MEQSIEFSDLDGDDFYLTQEANKIEGKWRRDNVANFDLGLEKLINGSTDSLESGCDLCFVEFDDDGADNAGGREVTEDCELLQESDE